MSSFIQPPLFPEAEAKPERKPVEFTAAATHDTNAVRGRIYDFIRKSGRSGATDGEIIVGCNIPGDTVRPRRGELVAQGLIEPLRTDGKEAKPVRRKTPSGRWAQVWVASRRAAR